MELKYLDYNKATLYAATGSILGLPDWVGDFKWDQQLHKLYFQNNDYYLYDLDQLKDRTDWYEKRRLS